MRVLYGERRSAVDSISSELGPLVEVLGGVTTPSGVFQSEVVVYSLAQFLLAAQIPFRRLNRCGPCEVRRKSWGKVVLFEQAVDM